MLEGDTIQFTASHVRDGGRAGRAWGCPRTECPGKPSPGSRVEITGGYYEYIDVSSCQDIIHLYHLLWSATILNIVGLFLGIITAAVLGGFKDMVRKEVPSHSRGPWWEP
ncbi:transmembrane protein 255A-like, partial [Lontra canadensis]|uniref:transmembrane protein 255A-like n=1 Tax=Lontra canadensis TaxID=76717 RepID=UPI0013F30BB7